VDEYSLNEGAGYSNRTGAEKISSVKRMMDMNNSKRLLSFFIK